MRDVPLGRVDRPHLGGRAPGSGAEGGLADSCEGRHGRKSDGRYWTEAVKIKIK